MCSRQQHSNKITKVPFFGMGILEFEFTGSFSQDSFSLYTLGQCVLNGQRGEHGRPPP